MICPVLYIEERSILLSTILIYIEFHLNCMNAAELSCIVTKSNFYFELDALFQFKCEIFRTAEIRCTLSRMCAVPPKLDGKRCSFDRYTQTR